MKKIIDKIRRNGIIETLWQSLMLLAYRLSSLIKIFLLRARGYDINYSAKIGKNVFFFQSLKDAIKINSKATIGCGVRIGAGFKGKITIGENVLVDDYSFIYAHNLIEIGSDTMIAASSYIVDFNHKYPLIKNLISKEEGYVSRRIKIGSNVWIGAHVVILPGVTIGDGVIVGAGSIVTKSITSNSVAVGNPAKIIKKVGN